ncbi:hypothetical protein Tco_0591178 [Tanacetum coccineum]
MVGNMNRIAIGTVDRALQKFDYQLKLFLRTLESPCALVFSGVIKVTLKLAWIKWSNILASLDKGVEVLKSIHGNEAGIELKGCQTNGLWARIVGTIYHLHLSGYVPLNSLRYQVGDGSMIRFWKDTCLWAWDWRRPGRALADLNNLLMDIGSLNVEVDKDCVVSSLSTDRSYSTSHRLNPFISCFPTIGRLVRVWCELKIRLYLTVMNGTYGTPREASKSRDKNELLCHFRRHLGWMLWRFRLTTIFTSQDMENVIVS